MGKPYSAELAKLAETYKWAASQNNALLMDAVRAAGHLPLLAVGSGGSLTAAEVMASCHQRTFHSLGRAVTPLELVSALPANREVSVWFFSAGGGNVDIRRAFKHALLSEPRQVAAVVGRHGSKMASVLSEHQYADLIEMELPAGRDGFLATNSLLAFTTLICNAYDAVSGKLGKKYASFDELMQAVLPQDLQLNDINVMSEKLWEKPVIHVIYSNELKSAAVDIESKFVEAGLSSIHLADFRNFAHGRHHWFAKHQDTSAILALSVPSDADLALKTLSLLPAAIPKLHVPFQETGSPAIIAGVALSLYLAGFAGKARKIDPGRPGVPDFGSKLYNLRADSGFIRTLKQSHVAIQRKVGTLMASLSSDRKKRWERAYHSFREEILKAEFRGIVLDYDGTIVDTRNRYLPPNSEVVDEINRLLRHGVVLGFATGRGKSIRVDLRKVIPREYWDQVVVGYYNGAEIAHLDQDDMPDGVSPPCSDLQDIFQSLQDHIEIMSLAKISGRKYQLTVEPTDVLPEKMLWELAQCELRGDCVSAPTIFRSSHSVDILAQGVSKMSVIAAVLNKIGTNGDVLAIGDRGKWPGNDSSLLKHVHSLSVDEVSSSPDTCWNVCPPGVRGVQGTAFYFHQLIKKPGSASSSIIKYNPAGIKL
jgi:hydroxymethylpyrimidine pyrophosphatase-like HAD family hydrolase